VHSSTASQECVFHRKKKKQDKPVVSSASSIVEMSPDSIYIEFNLFNLYIYIILCFLKRVIRQSFQNVLWEDEGVLEDLVREI
jgi:hypothetical protein